MHTPSPRRRTPVALSLALSSALLATAAVTPALATSTPGADAAGAGTSADIVGGGVVAEEAPGSVVTLITGDQAVVSYDADGRASAFLRTDQDYLRQREGDALYLVPVSAQAAVQAGTLDRELFNVTGLVEAGYDDASRDDIPVIVTGALPRSRGVQVGAVLESIGATAVSIDKESPDTTFASLSRSRSATRIWLDAKVDVTADLDPTTGVGQTGADRVWADGLLGEGVTVAVLDTGIDADHPDLTDRIVDAQDFTGGDNPNDTNGHGTHVASTIAGTGAESDGARAGMAPESDLLVGKVLGTFGGQESWIIEGMEWAVDSGADVVNMSLGLQQPNDCTDPIAQALDSLADQSLFVVSAGNLGADQTVTSPGCADGALTVAAVDSDSETARFSSRGMTPDHRVKPDIAAPGVAITGAAAGGGYTQMSGTSMAAPHVAGAAALVRQAHPDWSVQELREALTSSVKTRAEDGVLAQGSGELWVPGAVEAQVLASSSVTLGEFAWPHTGREKLTGEITYTNLGTEPVRLKLRVRDLAGADGRSLPGNTVRLDRSTVRLAAGESTTVQVTATDRAQGLKPSTFGGVGGRVVARVQHGGEVTSSFGYWLEPKSVDLTLDVRDHDGAPATSGVITVIQTDDVTAQQVALTGEPVTVRVRAGALSVNGFIAEAGEGTAQDYTYAGRPEIDVVRDTTLVLDAREAVEVSVRTDRPTDVAGATMSYGQIFKDYWYSGAAIMAGPGSRIFALPTKRAHDTDFTFGTYWSLSEEGVETSASDYVYNLAFYEEHRVSRHQTQRVRDDRLATVDETWHAQRDDVLAYDFTWTADPITGDAVTPGRGLRTVAAPHGRTALYTPGIPWTQATGTSLINATMMQDPQRVYEAGQRLSTEWNRLPSRLGLYYLADGSPSRIGERQGNLVGFAFAPWKDSVQGRTGISGFGDLGSLQVWIDGEEQEGSAWASGQWQVPDQAHLDVRVNQLTLPNAWNRASIIGTSAYTTYSFDTTRPEGDSIETLPVPIPTYDVPVDERNLVPAEAGTEIALGFRYQEGQEEIPFVEVTAQVTGDELPWMDWAAFPGLDWQDVEVVQRDGVWTLVVDNSTYAGRLPALHIVAVDADGNRVEQYLGHAYGVQ
ncbi:S8 family serine peptidase [Ornithinimicrobium sp. F0845]|uniref:S8 family serine peptidase n=1 Tax=Ornithinimicrobium sp. F0845 TaxID=2926412 RepID=UPI001FF633E4|nr:S8 family serine peptidase [Ornithinimicrobium sp. F0845]MCK0112916.1 S8 family serine peptidase [Ornithinimicrobium sp. F0845]